MKRFSVLPTLALLLATTDPAQAASFDCAKASTSIEKTLCGDAALSDLDELLLQHYKKAQLYAPSPDALKDQQKTWLKTVRDACPDATCLKKAYRARIGELTDVLVNAAPAAPATAISGTYARYFEGKVDTHSSDITLEQLPNGKVKVTGTALWMGPLSPNIGELDGTFALSGNQIFYRAGDYCKCTLTLIPGGLKVTEDNGGCGGMNVTFNGEYRKQKGGK